MFKYLISLVLLVTLVVAGAVETQAGYFDTEIKFVNTSPYVLYAYNIQAFGWRDVFYYNNLYFDYVLYPGKSITYTIDAGKACWFSFHLGSGNPTYWSEYWSTFIDTRWDPYDDVIYIY